MDTFDYIVDKEKLKNSNSFKKYIYIKYAIILICTICVILLLINLLINYKYNKAIKLYENKKYNEALYILKKHPNYKNTNTYLRKISYKNFNKYKIGDTVYFGSYNNKTISWKIIDIKDNNYLIISNGYIYLKDKYSGWKQSNIRNILNGEFYYKAFNDDEKNIIIPTLVDEYPNTIDKLYILEKDEINNYEITNPETLIFRGESVYWEEKLKVQPVMWISKENTFLNELDDIELYYNVDFYSKKEKDIINTKIEMYDYVLQKENKRCYYWRGIKENYYACAEEVAGERIITDENINEDAVEDILNKRGKANEKA